MFIAPNWIARRLLTSLMIVSTVLTFIACTGTTKENEKKPGSLVWKPAVLKNAATDSTLKTVSTLAPDGKTLTVLFDTAMHFRFPGNKAVDTTLNYTLRVPAVKSGKASYSVSNDLRYFVGKDSLAKVSIQVAVNNQSFDVAVPPAGFVDNDTYSFNYQLTGQQVNQDSLTIQYAFRIVVSKGSPAGDVVISFDSLDIGTKQTEEN